MKIRYYFLILAIFTLCNAQPITHEFEFDGHLRDYDVHLPTDYESGMPLVIVLPGYSETKDWFRQYSLIQDHADTSGYILAIATGSLDGEGTLSWNVGLQYCPIRGVMPTTDDVGFISAVIDSIHSEYDIDLSRVYCTGFSTGGELALRFAAQAGHRLAAVGSVAGTMYVLAETWTPIRSMPVLEIHGTRDNYSFYYHSDSTNLPHTEEAWSIPEMLNYWTEHNMCTLPPDTIDLPDLNTGDNCWVQQISFEGDSPSSDIVHYKIIEGGHHWPQGTINFNNGGNINRDIDGNEIHWEFFENYQNPLTELAFTDTAWVESRFVERDGGVLTLQARLRNPADHPVVVEGFLWGFSSGDSIFFQLQDDGTQGDGQANDGFFGSSYATMDLEEGFYYASVSTTDEFESLAVKHHKPQLFTTAGPVSYYAHSCPDSSIFPGEVIMVSLEILNESENFTFDDVEVQVRTDDLPMNTVGTDSRPYGDMQAGATAVNSLDFWLRIDPACPNDTTLSVGFYVSTEGHAFWSDSFQIYIQPAVAVSETQYSPQKFSLEQNFPNPFNPSTTINYDLPQASDVSLIVYDINGRIITSLVQAYKPEGKYSIQWKGIDDSGYPVSTGVYFCRLVAGEYNRTTKMVLLR